MADDKTEAQTIWKQFQNNPDGLAGRLTEICLTRMGVVYQVFAILDNFGDYNIGCRFWKKLPLATLQKLLETNEGIYFCRQLYQLLSKWNAYPSFFLPCHTTPAELFVLKAWLTFAKEEPNQTAAPRKLSEAEIDTYKKKRGKQTFDENIVWEMPESGAGFIAYNRNDMKADGLDQIGTKSTIEAIINIGREWNALHSDRKLQIGDISRPGGLDTSQHKGHQDGKIFDVRPMRNDAKFGKGANLNYKSTSYDRELTKEFVKMVRKLYPSIYIRFNDGEIAGKGEFTYVHKDSGGTVHNDHLHLEFR